MTTKRLFITLVSILVLATVAAGAYGAYKKQKGSVQKPILITSFEDCAKVYPVMESYPAQCKTMDGKSFMQDIGNELSKLEIIAIDTPRPNAAISSPLAIEGRARGTWYFEASFPVELLDASGNRIAQGPAQAQGEWMTENFVPYKLTLTYPKQQKGSKGKLILKKDNPSGEPSRDDSLIVPVIF